MVRGIGVTRLKRLSAAFKKLAGDLGRMLNIRETAQGAVEVVLEHGIIRIPRKEIMKLTLKWQFDDVAAHYLNDDKAVHTELPDGMPLADITIPLIGSLVDAEIAIQTAYGQGALAVEVVWPGDEHRQYPEAYQSMVDKLVGYAATFGFSAVYMSEGRLLLHNELKMSGRLL